MTAAFAGPLRASLVLRCFLLGLALATLPSCGETSGNRSGVVFLVDFSKTFAPLTADDSVALGRVFEAVGQMASSGRLEPPIKLFATIIGDRSLAPPSPCGAAMVYEPRLTAPRNRSEATPLSSPAKLLGALEACRDALADLSVKSVQAYTDISGALSLASSNLAGVSGERLIVVYSDFLEDLPKGQETATIDLQGIRVIMVWRPGMDDAKNLTATLSRIADWRNRLKTAGAVSVCEMAIPGLTVPDVSSCVWGSANEQ